MINLRLKSLGLELLGAAPTLIVIYGVLLTGLHAIPIRNPNANLERLTLLQQQLAFFATLDGFLVYSIGRDWLRKKY